MTYTYKCDTCGYIYTANFSLKAEKPKEITCLCGERMRRVYEAPAIKYKGEGFYTNDQWHDPNEDPDDL